MTASLEKAEYDIMPKSSRIYEQRLVSFQQRHLWDGHVDADTFEEIFTTFILLFYSF